MQPSFYSRLPPDRQKRFIRFLVLILAWGTVGFSLLAFRKTHIVVEVLMVAAMIVQIVIMVKFLKFIAANADDTPGPRT